MTSLVSVLFKDYRRRVLELLLLHPENEHHVREIARLTGTVAGTLHKELARLSDVGILLKEAKGRQLFYRANTDCPIYDELASILRKTSGLVDVLRDTLEPVRDLIDVALVFGSVAQGREHAGSDVDVLIVGDIEFATAVKLLYPAQQRVGRDINPKVYNRDEWQKMWREQGVFVKEIQSKEKLFILGSTDDLG